MRSSVLAIELRGEYIAPKAAMKTASLNPPVADEVRSAVNRRNSLRLILLAALPVLVALALQWVVWPILEPRAWVLLYPAVFLSSWFGGLRAGLGATVLATISGWYFFIPFERSFVVERPGDALSIGIFLLIGLLFSFLPDHLRRANERATTAAMSLKLANEQLNARVRERTEELEHIHIELREELETLKSIIVIQDEISADLSDPNAQMNLLVRRSLELTKADGAALAQLDGPTLVCRVASGIAAKEADECLRTGKTFICHDAESDPRVDLGVCQRVGLRSMLVMPLVAKGAKGVLKVLSARPGRSAGARSASFSSCALFLSPP